MDFVSHALWGGVTLGRSNRKTFLLVAVISVLPDILTEGLFGALYVLGIGGMPGWEHGHPNITDYPIWAQYLYGTTHSLVVFAIVFALLWLMARKPVWPIAAWGLHVLIDIPTHSLALFPTPFLWPLSSFRVDGVSWDTPAVWLIDISLLLAAYSFWLVPVLRRRHRLRREHGE